MPRAPYASRNVNSDPALSEKEMKFPDVACQISSPGLIAFTGPLSYNNIKLRRSLTNSFTTCKQSLESNRNKSKFSQKSSLGALRALALCTYYVVDISLLLLLLLFRFEYRNNALMCIYENCRRHRGEMQEQYNRYKLECAIRWTNLILFITAICGFNELKWWILQGKKHEKLLHVLHCAHRTTSTYIIINMWNIMRKFSFGECAGCIMF